MPSPVQAATTARLHYVLETGTGTHKGFIQERQPLYRICRLTPALYTCQSCTNYFDSTIFANSWDRIVLFGIRKFFMNEDIRSLVFRKFSWTNIFGLRSNSLFSATLTLVLLWETVERSTVNWASNRKIGISLATSSLAYNLVDWYSTAAQQFVLTIIQTYIQ